MVEMWGIEPQSREVHVGFNLCRTPIASPKCEEPKDRTWRYTIKLDISVQTSGESNPLTIVRPLSRLQLHSSSLLYTILTKPIKLFRPRIPQASYPTLR